MSGNHNHNHDHDHDHERSSPWLKEWLPAIFSGILLTIGLSFDEIFQPEWFQGWVRLIWYVVAYLPVGYPVAMQGFKLLLKGDVFTEFFLMALATLGAFYIGEYPEGVTVMLFYTVGELLQGAAVAKARNNIQSLLALRSDAVMVLREGAYKKVKPEDVIPGEVIQLKAGERVPLDGVLGNDATFNTAALTGESKPRVIMKGQSVLAGMINADQVVTLTVSRVLAESTMTRIYKLVQDAITRKAPTELFIRKFAKVYTPIVVFLAIGVVALPFFFVADYNFNQWLYRALIFLVISCPCALVISIPLGYFGGIGYASRHGILFKGSGFLDRIAGVNTVLIDKTGTLTKGVFKVQQVVPVGWEKSTLLTLVASLESHSNHPIAKAVVNHASAALTTPTDVQEIAGHGLIGNVNGHEVIAGNAKLLRKQKVQYDASLDNVEDTLVAVAIDGKYAGYLLIADELKDNVHGFVRDLHLQGVDKIVLLSGDQQQITQRVATTLHIPEAFGDLLPEGKLNKLKTVQGERSRVVAFVGDGINDAPVLAASDVGIAMGAMGSEAAIEIADVVIQDDDPNKVATAIAIGRKTRQIVLQNITLAFTVKIVVMVLGALGYASMWSAVFADVGVALLAILNAVRINVRKKS